MKGMQASNCTDWLASRSLASRVNKKRRVSYLYRTATTSYPCYIPVLGDFRGSWSYKTYPMQKYGLFLDWQAKKRKKLFESLQRFKPQPVFEYQHLWQSSFLKSVTKQEKKRRHRCRRFSSLVYLALPHKAICSAQAYQQRNS